MDILNLNTQLFSFIHGFSGEFSVLDWFFVIVTSYAALGIVFVLVAFYVLIYLPTHIPPSVRRLRAIAQAGEMIISLLTTWFVVGAIKVLIALPRPFETITEVTALVSATSGTSFPSGHAAMGMAVATAVYLHHKRFGRWLFWFAFFVGISRIYVGVHYPLDVLAGFAIGLAIPTLFYMALRAKPDTQYHA